MSQQEEMNQQQFMQIMQQKLGNLELTVQALMSVLQEEGVVDEEEINETAQEIVEEMQEQQGQAGEGQGLEDLDDELE
jgi:hypothetical protein